MLAMQAFANAEFIKWSTLRPLGYTISYSYLVLD